MHATPMQDSPGQREMTEEMEELEELEDRAIELWQTNGNMVRALRRHAAARREGRPLFQSPEFYRSALMAIIAAAPAGRLGAS